MPKVPKNYSLLCSCGNRLIIHHSKEGYYYCKYCKEFLVHYYWDEDKKDFVLSQSRPEEQHLPIYV